MRGCFRTLAVYYRRRISNLIIQIPFRQGIGATTKGKNDEKQAESSHDSIDIESSSPEIEYRVRKTSQNTAHYGSFFFRAGAVGMRLIFSNEIYAVQFFFFPTSDSYVFSAFGLGAMIYTGLQFGQIAEIPFKSPCFEMLRFVNPFLQAVFIFMQMHFIFMNARVNLILVSPLSPSSTFSNINLDFGCSAVENTSI